MKFKFTTKNTNNKRWAKILTKQFRLNACKKIKFNVSRSISSRRNLAVYSADIAVSVGICVLVVDVDDDDVGSGVVANVSDLLICRRSQCLLLSTVCLEF